MSSSSTVSNTIDIADNEDILCCESRQILQQLTQFCLSHEFLHRVFAESRVISRNLKLGVYRKVLGGSKNARSTNLH